MLRPRLVPRPGPPPPADPADTVEPEEDPAAPTSPTRFAERRWKRAIPATDEASSPSAPNAEEGEGSPAPAADLWEPLPGDAAPESPPPEELWEHNLDEGEGEPPEAPRKLRPRVEILDRTQPQTQSAWTPGALRRWLVIFFAAFVLVSTLLVVFYRAGRSDGYSVAKREDAPAAPSVSKKTAADAARDAKEALEALSNAALDQKTGKLEEARKLYEHALELNAGLQGVRCRLAWMAFSEGQMTRAEDWAMKAIQAGEDQGPADTLQGLVFMRLNQPKTANRFFSDAVAAEPLNATTYYLWGEALRRQGRSTEASEKLRLAVEFNQEPGLNATYAFQWRMAQIEAGQTAEITAALPEMLKKVPPSPEWLLTSAALAFERNDPTAAAADLRKARDLLPQAVWVQELRDFYFYDRCSAYPETAVFLKDAKIVP